MQKMGKVKGWQLQTTCKPPGLLRVLHSDRLEGKVSLGYAPAAEGFEIHLESRAEVKED